MLSDWLRRIHEAQEMQKRATGSRWLHDCDFCERKDVRCYALDHRLIGREDVRGEVIVEPAWICETCFKARSQP